MRTRQNQLSQDEQNEIPVFIAYRRGPEEGDFFATELNEALDGKSLLVGNQGEFSLKVFFDRTTPASGDWTEYWEVKLKTARAFLLICTPGVTNPRDKRDILHKEINWWLRHRRKVSPIIVDPTEIGEAVVPGPILGKWPRIERLDWPLPADRNRLHERIRAGIVVSMAGVNDQEIRRLEWRNRLLVAFLFVVLILSGGLGVALYFTAIARNEAQVRGDVIAAQNITIKDNAEAIEKKSKTIFANNVKIEDQNRTIIDTNKELGKTNKNLANALKQVTSERDNTETQRKKAVLEANRRTRETAKLNWRNANLELEQNQNPVLAGHYFRRAMELFSQISDPGKEDLDTIQNLNLAATALDTRGHLEAILEHKDRVLQAEFGCNANQIITAHEKGPVLLWNLTMRDESQPLSKSIGIQSQFVLSHDRRHIVTWHQALPWETRTSEPRVTLFDLETRKSWELGNELRGQTTVQFSNDDQRVMVASSNGTVEVWDPTSPKAIAQITIAERFARAEMNRKGNRIIASTHDGKPNGLFDGQTGRLIAALNDDQRGTSARFNSLGDRVLTGGPVTGTVPKLWNAESGEMIATLADRCWNVTFSRDGAHVIAHGIDNTFRIWDSQSGRLEGSLLSRTFLPALFFDCVGNRVAMWGGANTVRLWNVQTGDLVAVLAHSGGIHDVMFTSNGARLLTWSNDGNACLWDSQNGGLLRTFRHRGIVRNAALLNKDTKLLTWADDGMIRFWNPNLEWPEAVFAGAARTTNDDGLYGVSLDKTGNHLLSWGGDGSVRVWVLEDLGVRSKLHCEGIVTGGKLLRNGENLLTWGDDGLVRLWDLGKGKLIFELDQKSPVHGVYLEDNGRFAVTWGADNTLRLWDVNEQHLLKSWNYKEPVRGAICRFDGRRVLASYNRNSLLWDVAKESPLQVLQGWGCFSADGKRAVTSDFDLATIANSDDGAVLHQIRLALPKTRFWFRSASSFALLTGDDGSVSKLDLAADLTTPLTELPQNSSCIIWPEDGPDVLICSNESGVLWNGNSRKTILRVIHDSYIKGAKFTRDKRWIITWSADRMVKVWNRKTGILVGQAVHHEPVGDVAIDSLGEKLVIWGNGDVARLCAIASGQTIALLPQTSTNQDAAFCEDDRMIMTRERNSIVRLWDARTGYPLHEFRFAHGIAGAEYYPQSKSLLTWGGDADAKFLVCNGVVYPLREFETRSGTRMSESGEFQILSKNDWEQLRKGR